MDSSDGSQHGKGGDVDLLLERIDRLESRVAVLEARQVEPAALSAPPLPAAPLATSLQRVPPPPRPQDVMTPVVPAPQPARASVRFNEPIGTEPVLRWAGIALLFLAAAFLVSTAVSRGWIGPELQFLGAGALGVALLWWSLRIRSSSPAWALAAAHGGVGVLAVTAFAGWDGLDLYGRPTALVVTVAVVAAAVATAVLISRSSVAAIATVVAVLSPLAVGAPEAYPWVASSLWLFVVIVGFTAIGVERRWTSLRILVFVITAIPLLALSSRIGDDGTTVDLVIGLCAAVVSVAAFVIAPLIANGRSSDASDASAGDAQMRSMEHRLMATVPPFAWLVVGMMLVPTDNSRPYLLAFGVAAVFAVVFAGLRRLRAMTEPMLLSGVVGVSVLVSIGLAGLLDGPALLVALAAQAIGFGWLAARFDDVFLRINAGVLGLVAAAWTASELIQAIERGATLGQHLASLFVVLALGGLAGFVRDRPYFAPTAVVAWIGWLAWLASVLGELPQGQVAVSISWAVCGAVVFMVGLRSARQHMAQVGLATLAVTVLKLVSIDLEAVDTMWRAGLFFVVGLGLLRLGLLVGSDRDSTIEGPPRSDEGEGQPVPVP